MTYGNLAYKHDYAEERRTPSRPPKRKRAERVHSDIGKPIGYPLKIASVIAVTVSAIFMIVQFVEVNETADRLATAKSEYEFEESVTSQKSFELEQSIDLSKIEQEAQNRLGMSRPDSHQMIYLDVPKDDVTEKTADEVEGFGNRVSAFFKKLIGNIVDYFSI